MHPIDGHRIVIVNAFEGSKTQLLASITYFAIIAAMIILVRMIERK